MDSRATYFCEEIFLDPPVCQHTEDEAEETQAAAGRPRYWAELLQMMNFLSLLHRASPSPASRIGLLVGQISHVLRPPLASAGPTSHTVRQSLVTLAARHTLLQPTIPSLVQVCGMKQKGRLRRRCKDCYFVMARGRLYVECKTKPRHKQMSMQKSEKNTWILTWASQSPTRPW